MITDAAAGVRLPHVDALNPKVPTALLGRTLAIEMEDMLAEPLPERLTSLVSALEVRARIQRNPSVEH